MYDWAPAIALYACVVIAYVVFNMRMMPPSIHNVSAQDPLFASSVALSTIGIAVIWPVALVVVGYFVIKSKIEARRLKTPFFRRLNRGESIQEILEDLGGVDGSDELPPLPTPSCGSCGGEIVITDFRHGNLSRIGEALPSLRVAGAEPTVAPIDSEFVNFEQFVLCGDCYERISEEMTPAPPLPMPLPGETP